ncbi:DUF808 domain-containing protein [Chitinibacter bivalviorum]|uniref:DUF808 domain-containing protein n=1 Tax=Chitinibacter bivalviorum TaxID=2739434 RepID=A0A7H9BGF9_9NEIS|nr:DUF808 domain-containing protein [Chitinibacter bivalviorum]QLG87346.1 DUF808 domain-containing protein [Chitinibacter bivalviorum]
MAGASLLALIDDIASVLDDVALMTKVAAKKTAGVLGDDLALNAEQVNGVRAERELPVVWAVAVGSLKNKLILVPAALAISAILPQAIVPLLMIGGLYLCFEGVEKLAHKFLHSADEDHAHEAELIQAVSDENIDLVALEKEKITGAIRTDFVLSAEIIVIALGTVNGQPFMTQLAVLAGIGMIMTVGVYGIVAGIVKLDDIGFYLMKKSNSLLTRLGRGLVAAAPKLMKALTVIGTAAMFLVGGGILTHGLPFLHHGIEGLTQESAAIAGLGPILHALVPSLADLIVGVIAGTLCLVVVQLGSKILQKNN